jgi:endoglucanase
MRHRAVLRIAVVVIVVLVVVGIAAGVYDATTHENSSTNGTRPHVVVPFLTVSGNQLVNSAGKPTRLVGVNIGASQYYCLGKYGAPFPTPIDGASVTALQSWHVNSVRILLDEYCWLGVNGEPSSMSVAAYRKDIENFVSLLNAAHIEVILAMTAATGSSAQSASAGGGTKSSNTTPPMAQAATAPAFWGSVASTFRYSPGVIFDLFGEPQLISWTCWSHGCTVRGTKVTGMQQLVDAVRATGARQPMMLGGVDWSNNLIGWLANEPKDPDKQLIASVHVYQKDHCNNAKCWTATIAPVAEKVPVVSGEFGDENCSTHFTKRYMKWSDAHAVSYLAWSWLVGQPCSDGGTLISSYSGTPSAYGTVIKDQVAAVSATGVTDLDPT